VSITQPDDTSFIEEQLSEILINRRAMFVLWMVQTGLCTSSADFLQHYHISNEELNEITNNLLLEGFLQQDGENFILTELGEKAVKELGPPSHTYTTSFLREDAEIHERFDRDASPQVGATVEGIIPAPGATSEADLVEDPFLAQLRFYRWQHIGPQERSLGDPFFADPSLTERNNFREVLLEGRLRTALKNIKGQEWLDEQRINRAIRELKNIDSTQLIAANRSATELLLSGVQVPGDPNLHHGRNVTINYIDFDNIKNNDFLVINQFRVDLPGKRFIIADIVLFVNGIPLVIIECKNPTLTSPLEEGIRQLLRYSGVKTSGEIHDDEENVSVRQLFVYNQLMVVTCYYHALCGTVGSTYEHYQEWKEPAPDSVSGLAQELGIQEPNGQQILAAGMLQRDHLLDLVRHFTLFRDVGGKMVKIIARYHQVRAVHNAVERLRAGKTRLETGDRDRRGGIIWHTQGSGKSLTMVFLVRKMRTDADLKTFKVVFVTDRKDLEEQLSETARLIGQSYHIVRRIRQIAGELGPTGHGLVFAMIQKYQQSDEDMPTDDEMNPSTEILVLVDEAHRSHDRELHARLEKALPNSAMIGFTGTPIIMGEKKRTYDIFGPYIDRYTIQQSELDGATLPIFYEARETYQEVVERLALDEKYDQLMQTQPRSLNEVLLRKFATIREALEAEDVVAVKAEDMLRHYTINVLPNSFKAMITAVSRLAAVRYQLALTQARQKLIQELHSLPLDLLKLPEADRVLLDSVTQWQIRAYPQLSQLETLEFAAVVSKDEEDSTDERISWTRWTDESTRRSNTENFKKPFLNPEQPNRQTQSSLAFLCVQSMLITGFDAPIAQVLYLDRPIKNYELLQAIARVNRTSPDKTNGLVVDYYGIVRHLKEALMAYSAEEVQGALISLKDELPRLADRHRRVLAIFQAAQLDLENIEDCAKLLSDSVKVRADFEIKFKKFLESMDTVLPRPQALPYVSDMQRLGAINRRAATILRNEQLALITTGNKVRKLIDEHIDALKVRQLFEPIKISDPNFETKISLRPNDETKAAEMEHLLRYYIEQHRQEDPTYYSKLSERLDEILQTLQGNWSAVVGDLQELINQVRAGRQIDKTGLDPRTERPFLGILEEEVRKGSPHFAIPHQEGVGRELHDEELLELAAFTSNMIAFIRHRVASIPDFWRRYSEREDLRKYIFQEIDKAELVEEDRCEYVADRVAELARYLHVWLIETEDMKRS
jgi:type I restriction enzyme R subunit